MMPLTQKIVEDDQRLARECPRCAGKCREVLNFGVCWVGFDRDSFAPDFGEPDGCGGWQTTVSTEEQHLRPRGPNRATKSEEASNDDEIRPAQRIVVVREGSYAGDLASITVEREGYYIELRFVTSAEE
jgi:hypothetical protein